ncbi:hypothetical protein [Streptomyces sp. NPDC018584]|uniref:hypothetical protein n=1 Tax=unclassified Streptomyces TaxID=2593676 RepID=UPI0037AE0E14
MLATVTTAALAVVATLLGAIVSGRFQERAAERGVRATHSEAIRRDRLDAVTALAAAISDHRRAMWGLGDAILHGADTARVTALRAESHATRSTVTHPMVALRVLIEDQAVRAAADDMVARTYAMRDAYTDTADLAAARETAKTAHDLFVDAAAHYLTRAA